MDFVAAVGEIKTIDEIQSVVGGICDHLKRCSIVALGNTNKNVRMSHSDLQALSILLDKCAIQVKALSHLKLATLKTVANNEEIT